MRKLLKKSTYLVILYILFLQGLNFAPLANFGGDVFFILIIGYLFFGKYIYRRTQKILFPKKYYICIRWIFIGIFLSMISAALYYHQSIVQSLITYRTQYLMITPFFLAKMGFSREDVIQSLYKFTWVFSFFYLLRYIIPGLFIISETYIDGDAVVLPGYTLLTIPLYYTLQKLNVRIRLRDILFIIFVIGLIFLQGNRSTLFPVLILSCWMFLKVKSKYRIPFIIFISFIAFVAILQVWDTLHELIEETQHQLNDPKYNRNKAFVYFIEAFSPNLWCTIFGNGFLSSHSTSIMRLLMERGIYNSDLGFVGYWNQFGLIPICVFLYLYISAIFRKTIPYYLKSIAIQTLICGLTISYFGSTYHMIFFIVFYYLYFINFTLSYRK